MIFPFQTSDLACLIQGFTSKNITLTSDEQINTAILTNSLWSCFKIKKTPGNCLGQNAEHVGN